MGIGDIGGDQLDRLRSVINGLSSDSHIKNALVVLHHAPVRHEGDVWLLKDVLRRRTNSDAFEHTFLAMSGTDAKALLAILDNLAAARRDLNVVLLHGHRHQKYLGITPAGTHIVEAPALVENENGFWLGWEKGGKLEIGWSPRGESTTTVKCGGSNAIALSRVQ
jgi:hypothetical protein